MNADGTSRCSSDAFPSKKNAAASSGCGVPASQVRRLSRSGLELPVGHGAALHLVGLLRVLLRQILDALFRLVAALGVVASLVFAVAGHVRDSERGRRGWGVSGWVTRQVACPRRDRSKRLSGNDLRLRRHQTTVCCGLRITLEDGPILEAVSFPCRSLSGWRLGVADAKL